MKINLFAKKFLWLLISATAVTTALANPVLDKVTSGNVTLSETANNLEVNQSSQQAILEWNSFNIAAGEKTQFVQPNANAIALNRINPSEGVSQIYGSLTSNGRIILINGAGIHFGNSAVVNVGSLIASTADISNANFIAGNYIFDHPSSFSGSIINEGRIRAAHYGLVALIGENIENHGIIRASLGTVILATGNKFTLDFYGDQLINFSVTAPAAHGGRIQNTGSIFADGGKILISAQAAQGVLDNVIDMQGVLQANSVSSHNGEIILTANQGSINISGKISAKGNHTASGGSIKVLAKNIAITPKAVLDASGLNGGSVLLAANGSTAADLMDADQIDISTGSMIKADSLHSGNGGLIAIAANNATVAGELDASAKGSAGKGGHIQIAGTNIIVKPKAYLNVSGSIGGLAEIGSANTSFLDMAAGSLVDASAKSSNGTGGVIDVLANTAHIDAAFNVSAKLANSFAGEVALLGQQVFLESNASIDASGSAGGGNIQVGNNQTKNVTLAAGSVLDASALAKGNGGVVGIWAQDKANLAGNIAAKGGYSGGNGGSIIITSNDFTNVSGHLDASANGAGSLGGMISIYGVTTHVKGDLNVSANQIASAGGQVKVLGEHVYLDSDSYINASGGAAGGLVNIGGSLSGSGVLENALDTTVSAGSVIDVSASLDGNGGQAIIYSLNKTEFAGKILAEGGLLNGNGGFAEVSSHNLLSYNGTVNTLASHGNTGTLLLDPTSITIQNSAAPDANSSVLTVSTLQNALTTSNVLVQTAATGNQVGDITVANNVTWNNANTLELSAFRNINVNATIANNNGGSLIVNADNTRDGTGTINFNSNGEIDFSNGGLVSLFYNTNSIAHPNFYYDHVSVSNGTQFRQDPLNALTTEQNGAIISSIVQMTSYLPFVSVASAQADAAPLETDTVLSSQPETVTTMDNDLEKVVEEDKPIQFELASSENSEAAKTTSDNAASTVSGTSNDFIIK